MGISIPDGGANGSSPFVAADVEFRPDGFTGRITNDWATVPYCTTDFAPYGNPTADHLSQVHNPANIARGIGDICRYMGVVDGASWRMPTATEWAELYGSTEQDKGQSVKLGGGWVAGNYYPLSGRAMGPHQTRVAITSNTQVDNADPYDDGAVFLPASGYREATAGAIYVIGSHGYCWSSTASTIDGGYHIRFDSTTVWPQGSNARTYGFSVRCIRE